MCNMCSACMYYAIIVFVCERPHASHRTRSHSQHLGMVKILYCTCRIRCAPFNNDDRPDLIPAFGVPGRG